MIKTGNYSCPGSADFKLGEGSSVVRGRGDPFSRAGLGVVVPVSVGRTVGISLGSSVAAFRKTFKLSRVMAQIKTSRIIIKAAIPIIEEPCLIFISQLKSRALVGEARSAFL